MAECPTSQIWCIPYINISPTLGSHRQHRWSRYQAALIILVSQVAPDTPWPDLDRLGWENEFASNWAAGGPNTPSYSDAKLVLSSQSAETMRKHSDITHSQYCWATTFVKLIEIFCFWSSISSQFVHKQKHSNCYQTEPRWGDWSQGVLVNLVHLCKDSIVFHHERTFSDVYVCHLDIIDKV